MKPFYARMSQVVMPNAPATEPVLILWRDRALETGGLRVVGTGAPPRQVTRTTLCWDANGLEAVFSCMDVDIVAEQKGPGNVKLWKDDCVYLWLDPGHSHNDDGRFVMIQISAGSETLVQRDGRNESAPAGLVTRAGRVEGGWTARLRLAWDCLGLEAPQPGAVWGFNVTRMDQPGRYDFDAMEMASLVDLPGGNLSALDAWGHLLFAVPTGTAKDDASQVAAGRKAMEKTHGRRIDSLGSGYFRELLLRKREDEERDARRGLPANPRATPDAYKVLQYLTGLTDRTDKRVLLAQDIWSYEGGLDGGYDRFVAKLAEQTGTWLPMLHVSYPDSSVGPEKSLAICADANRHAIAYWKAGGLVTIHTNPANPWTGKADLAHRENLPEVIKAGTPANLAWMRSLDALASHLAELRDAGVVVLWRPLHEMTFTNCYWYDCGATPDREVFKDVWRFMFRYFTYVKGLDNLLWVYSAADVGSWNGPAADSVYPGGDYVDVAGLSLYGNSVQVEGGSYEKLVALGKPFAFSEFGPAHQGGATGMKADAGKPFDNMTLIRSIRERYPRTIYAAYWHSWPGAAMSIVDNPNAAQLLDDPWVASRHDVDWKGIVIPDLEARRRRIVNHKVFEFPAGEK
jgi:mannan endo-1,4-beta-mannosidase